MSALPRILQVSRRLAASADLDEILALIIDALRNVLDAERATVFQFEAKTHELVTRVAHGTSEFRSPLTAGLAGDCARTRRIICVDDAYADARFNPAIDRQTGFRTRSLLCVPLIDHDGELIGVAQVLNHRGGPFQQEDEAIADALAAHAAVALRRGRLIEDRLERRRLERDLEVARQIQQGTFPASIPQPAGFEIAAWNRPASQTGGDAYDVVMAKDAARAVLLMADATGHGVGPSLSVTQLRSMLRMAVRLGADLDSIAQQANAQLALDLPPGRFITAWLGELDVVRGTLRSLSAGQAPLLLIRASGECSESLAADCAPLGVGESLPADAGQSIALGTGDVFAVLSDGIFDARNADGREWGVEAVGELLRKAVDAGLSASQIVERLRNGVEAHMGERPAVDDQTMIVLRRT